MRKELKKGDTEYDLFNDYWKLTKEFNIPEDNDEYWESLVSASDEFCEKYDSQYARDLVLAFMTRRETMWKSLKKSLLQTNPPLDVSLRSFRMALTYQVPYTQF